jgi:hypothetical protein
VFWTYEGRAATNTYHCVRRPNLCIAIMTDLAADETQCALAEGRGYFPRVACRVIDVLVDRKVAIRTNGHGCLVEE